MNNCLQFCSSLVNKQVGDLVEEMEGGYYIYEVGGMSQAEDVAY